jgi:hypothetical protein
MNSKEDFKSELESRLNEFYHQKIVPLEKEVLRLGGKLPEGEEVNLKFRHFNPLDPFKEGLEIVEYWTNPSSEYYRFFERLFYKCIERSWIKFIPPYSKDDTLSYWMYIFGCKTELPALILKKDAEYPFLSPIQWQGQKNICIYLIRLLIKEKYVSQKGNNELIKNHFLPSSKISSIANGKNPSEKKKKDLEELIFEITSSLE